MMKSFPVQKLQVPQELNCRSCHTSVTYGNIIYYFGGHFKELNEQTNIITKFYPQKKIWIDLHPKKNKPYPRNRCSHSANIFNNSMYIFGGGGGTTRETEYYLNDFWKFDFITEEWEEIKTEFAPNDRDSHVSDIWKNNLIIHGGHCDHSMFEDLHIFNFEQKTWKKINFDKKMITPGSRTRHGGIVYKDNFFIFGGYRHGQLLNDLFSLDLNSMEWKKIELRIQPSHRRSHMVTLHRNHLYSIGGFNGIETFNTIHRIDLEQLKSWEEFESNNLELPRRGVGTVSLYKNEIYFFGGNLESDYYNDVYLIELFPNKFHQKLKNCEHYQDVEIKFN